MKHTQTMTYNPTTESRELFVYLTNNYKMHRRAIEPALDNLRKKARKDIYDNGRAVDLWYYVATEGSKEYYKDFGYSFSVQDRYTVAVELEDYYREEVFEEV